MFQLLLFKNKGDDECGKQTSFGEEGDNWKVLSLEYIIVSGSYILNWNFRLLEYVVKNLLWN